MGRNTFLRGPGVLLAGLFGALLLALSFRASIVDLVPGSNVDGPLITTDTNGQVMVRSSTGAPLFISTSGDGSMAYRYRDLVELTVVPDRRAASARMMVPTSLQWRHPLAGLPAAGILAAAENGRGPMRIHTVLEVDHGELPVLSLVAPDAAFFDPDSGLLVVGNTMFNAPSDLERSYARDPRFWKYPGNFHGRGKQWERGAVLQCLAPEGEEQWQVKARIRINGQMTRGFPQHALRVLLDEPLRAAPWGDVSAGATSFVIRAAGNDQVKAMMRDAYQHGLCDGLSFEVSKAMPCVLYINGAYWGLHHLRQRMDDEELARRYDVKPKKITIVEDLGVLYKGDPSAPDQLLGLVANVERWDGQVAEVAQLIEAQLDVPEFLQYMAAQMVLGNMDWPRQNVKYWRYEGKPSNGTKLDGRWHMVMGDSDLGFGANASPEHDMFQKVRPLDSPTARLFMGMMRSSIYRELFRSVADDLVSGPLSSARCKAELDRMVLRLSPEMQRHTARWRKPVDVAHWNREVLVLREFADKRQEAVRAQLHRFIGS
jgi:hypothetical protein